MGKKAFADKNTEIGQTTWYTENGGEKHVERDAAAFANGHMERE